MAVECWKCIDKNCKGHVLFDNADFDFNDLEILNGVYAFTEPRCSECGKKYLVIPSYTVVLSDSDNLKESERSCISEHENRLI